MADDADVHIRLAVSGDIAHIESLYISEMNRPGMPEHIKATILSYPSALACLGPSLIGFAYCQSFAPDIVELANILVVSEHRSRGVGTLLLRTIESAARGSGYCGLVAVNSSMYEGTRNKRSAKNFYLRNGYSVILATPRTNVFGTEL